MPYGALGVGERLSVSQWKTRKFDVERFSLQELKDVRVTGQYQCKVWRFSALEKLRGSGYENVVSESIREF